MFFPDAPDIERHTLVGATRRRSRTPRSGSDSRTAATDWEDSLDEVDVFYNLGPNHVHAEPSIAALEAGVPVLCEKPRADPRRGRGDARRRGRRRRARRHRVTIGSSPRSGTRRG